MSCEEAAALFARIYQTVSRLAHACVLSLDYYQPPGTGKRVWGVAIKHWNSNLEWYLAKEQDWEDYKQEFLKTDEEVAEAMPTQPLHNP